MILFYSPIHGFIHKVLVVAHEAGLAETLEIAPTFPTREGHDITALNPLNKVPTLVLDDGRALYGSQVICEYFDSFNRTAPLFPPAGDARWDAVRRLSLADQSFEINVQIILDKTPAGQTTFDWAWPKLMRAFDQMERDAATYGAFDVGQASTLQTLSYFDRSCRQGLEVFGVNETYDWTASRPRLAAWFAQVIERPSVQGHFGREFSGDTGPEQLKANVARALRLRS
jgi:glutathione S-transferase